jgi:superfamily II DNA or RNA helicase
MIPKFQPGQVVRLVSDPDQCFPVLNSIPGDGAEARYQVWHQNRQIFYYESQLVAVDDAADRRAVDAETLRATITALQLRSPSSSRLYSFNSGRIQHIPHQYRPVLKLIQADRPRLLIADEVGVGKTIEAGLILKELQARSDVRSVLIICPKPLVAEKKWLNEMLRFDEEFVHLDGPTLRHCIEETDRDGRWPDRQSRAILPFSLFSDELLNGRPRRGRSPELKGLVDLEETGFTFDLVIVDEAHHLRNSATLLHQGVKFFCDRAGAVLFLTATPIQLEERDLYTLLNLLRPDLVIDDASFRMMSEPNPHLNAAIGYCRRREPGWEHAACEAMEAAANTTWGRMFIAGDPSFQEAAQVLRVESSPDDELRVELVQRLESFYTFAPLINRTRRRDIGSFTTRRARTEEVPFTPDQLVLHDELLETLAEIHALKHGHRGVQFMMSTIRRQAASCLHGLAPLLHDIVAGKLEDLEALALVDDEEGSIDGLLGLRTQLERIALHAEFLPPDDPKAERLEQVVFEQLERDNGKILLFSTFRHTLAYLFGRLRARGLRVGLIHGGVDETVRAEIRERFALSREHQEAVDILLSSEVGCEGLDFQFCDCLVNYDLPWNPMRIEQRIGRIDRYGQQSETVAIVNFVTSGTVDADIYHRCLLRIGVFESAIGGSEVILGDVSRGLRAISDDLLLSPEERRLRLQQLADNQIRLARAQNELEDREAELFGLSAASWNETLAHATSAYLGPAAVESLVTRYVVDCGSAERSPFSGGGKILALRANQQTRSRMIADFRRLPTLTGERVARFWESWLMGSAPLRVTFTQEGAREDRRIHLLDATHPLVRQAAAHFAPGAPLYCALGLRSDAVLPGIYPFGIFCWEKTGVRADQEQVAVAFEPELRDQLFTLLNIAEDVTAEVPDEAALREIERAHYALWRDATVKHVERSHRLVDCRVASLKSSHAARLAVLHDALKRTTDRKISIMKSAEIARAESDYERRLAELELARSSADVIVSATVFGTLRVEAIQNCE